MEELNSENQITQIVKGYKNLIFKKPEIEEEASKRLKICESCGIRNKRTCDSHRSEHAATDFKYQGKDRIAGITYKGCGCNIDAKCRSINSQCPLGKWLKNL